MAVVSMPIIIGVLVVFFGTLAGSVVTAIISMIVFVVLNKNGMLKKYCNSSVDWQRVIASIAKALLILIMIGSYILSVLCTILLVNALNSD